MRLRPFASSVMALMLLSACVAVPDAPPPPARPPGSTQVPPSAPPPPTPARFRTPQVMRMPGLEEIIDKDAAGLIQRFGYPRLDVREGDMRKLQFAGEACVLDIFLYPLRPGAEPVATYVEARRGSDGLDVDRAACAGSLQRK